MLHIKKQNIQALLGRKRKSRGFKAKYYKPYNFSITEYKETEKED